MALKNSKKAQAILNKYGWSSALRNNYITVKSGRRSTVLAIPTRKGLAKLKKK